MFENNGHIIHVYSPEAGGKFFFKNKILLSIWSFVAIFPLYDFVRVFPIQTVGHQI